MRSRLPVAALPALAALALAVLAFGCQSPEIDSLVHVVSVSPRDQRYDLNAPIRLVFDRPVVGEAVVGQGLREDPVVLQPPAEVTSTWTDRQTLVVTVTSAVVLTAFGRLAIVTLYGPAYEPAAGPLVWIAWGIVMMSQYVLLSRDFTARDRQVINVIAAYVALGGNVGLNYYLIPRMGILGAAIEPDASSEIARRARGTPRIANRLLRRVRDFAQVKADGQMTAEVARAAMTLLEVDQRGFDEVDRKLLQTIVEKFGGGPVGIGSIAAAISEEKDAIEDIYEPYLIQIGFLDRTPRGRVATARAYAYFGLPAPGRDTRLW